MVELDRFGYVAVAALGGVFLALDLLRCLRCAPWLFLQLRAVALRLRGLRLRKHEQEDKVEEAVQLRLREWQVEQFRWGVRPLAFLCAIGVCVTVWDKFLLTSGPPLALMEGVQPVVLVFIYAAVQLVMLRPSLVNVRNLDLWFGLLALPTIAFFSWQQVHEVSRTLVIFICCARMDVHLTLGFGFARFFAIWVQAGPAFPDFMTATLLSVFIAYVRRCALQRARAMVEAEILTVQKGALENLLRNFYDVVLELDAGWRIRGDGKDLSTFLLQGTTHEGRDFLSFFSEEEVEEVKHRLQRPAAERSFAEVLHLGMKGLDSSALQVEVFAFAYEGLEGENSYVVALREEHEDTAPSAKEGQISVRVDAAKDGLPVLSASPAFGRLCPAPLGSPLAKKLMNAEEFGRWLQRASGDVMDGEAAEPAEVVLQTRGKSLAKARCVVKSVDVVNEGGVEVEIRLNKVRAYGGRRGSAGKLRL